MTEERFDREKEEGVSVHIFTTSAAMIGVCLTVIGILTALENLRKVSTLANEAVALNAGGFLASCVLAYFALRAKKAHRRHRLEQCADVVFLTSLLMIVLNCVLVAQVFFKVV